MMFKRFCVKKLNDHLGTNMLWARAAHSMGIVLTLTHGDQDVNPFLAVPHDLETNCAYDASRRKAEYDKKKDEYDKVP